VRPDTRLPRGFDTKASGHLALSLEPDALALKRIFARHGICSLAKWNFALYRKWILELQRCLLHPMQQTIEQGRWQLGVPFSRTAPEHMARFSSLLFY
jgi:hypothetical protein